MQVMHKRVFSCPVHCAFENADLAISRPHPPEQGRLVPPNFFDGMCAFRLVRVPSHQQMIRHASEMFDTSMHDRARTRAHILCVSASRVPIQYYIATTTMYFHTPPCRISRLPPVTSHDDDTTSWPDWTCRKQPHTYPNHTQPLLLLFGQISIRCMCS